MKTIKEIFKIEQKPRRGLIAMEWVVLAYLALTLLMALFTYTKLANPQALIGGRLRIVAIIIAMWIVYRLVPCRFTMLCRVVVQMLLLSWWYPDTYEFNRMFPNLDHIFATAEQAMFGFQPALTFARDWSSPIVSELMDMGYAMYYPMIAVVCFYYFFRRYDEFERCAFVIIAAFFIYYVVFIFLPVTGPTYYYKAVGVDQIAKGVFPNVQDYFNHHQECLPTPGWSKGLFYNLVEGAKAAGERPTAAFPSSHVGISTICMLFAWRTKDRRLFLILLFVFVFLCLSTVYIQAHYVIDAIAGLVSGVVLYYALMYFKRD